MLRRALFCFLILSPILAPDLAGRPMPVCRLQAYLLRPGEVLLMSEYSPISFDGRYFGLISKVQLQSVVGPVGLGNTFDTPEPNMTRKEKQRRRQEPKDNFAAMNRALNAALARRNSETAQERQKAFGRIGKRPPGVLDGW